jgi:hypothetical protein
MWKACWEAQNQCIREVLLPPRNLGSSEGKIQVVDWWGTRFSN